MSIGGGSSSGQSQTQLDPQIKQDWQNLFDRATSTANGATPTQSVAGFTPTEVAGQAQTVAGAYTGLPDINKGAQVATQLTNNAARPGTITADKIYGDTSQSNPGSFGTQQITAQSFPGSNLSGYLDPYRKEVFDTSLGQLDQARRESLVGNSADATLQGGEGAWNGARAGVADSLTNRDFGRTAASLAANLNSTGFNTAAGLQQSDAQRALAAAQSNQGADLSRSQTIYGGDLTTNLANQSAINNIAMTNASNDLTASNLNAGYYDDNLNRQLSAAQLLGSLGGQAQSAALTGANAVTGVGQQQQQQAQAVDDANYQNAMNKRNLPLQTIESAFGIIPNTGSGSMTHSSGKGANVSN